MGTDIERRFLVKDEGWKTQVADSYEIIQGYLPLSGFVFSTLGDGDLDGRGRATFTRDGHRPVVFSVPFDDVAALAAQSSGEARLRLKRGQAFLAFKQDTSDPQERTEREYFQWNAEEARRVLTGLCMGRVVKTRHEVHDGGSKFKLDVYGRANEGLVTAKIKLGYAHETFPPPAWLGAEVTDDRNYRNLALAMRPYSTWWKPAPALVPSR